MFPPTVWLQVVDMRPNFVCVIFLGGRGERRPLFPPLKAQFLMIFFFLVSFFFSSNCFRNDFKPTEMQSCSKDSGGTLVLHSALTFWMFRIGFYMSGVYSVQSAQHPGVGKALIICSVTIIVFFAYMPGSQLCTPPSLPLKTHSKGILLYNIRTVMIWEI